VQGVPADGARALERVQLVRGRLERLARHGAQEPLEQRDRPAQLGDVGRELDVGHYGASPGRSDSAQALQVSHTSA
jgi:hypothetical protein